MKQETLEMTADSLDEARSRVTSKMPQGFCVLSETVISDGQPVTIRESAETINGARTAVRSRVPKGSRIDHEKETRQSEVKTIRISADTQEAARNQAQSQLNKTTVIKTITLAIAGKRGFLGIGKTQNQYNVEVLKYAEVEIRFKTDAKIAVTICPEEEMKKEVYATFNKVSEEEHDKMALRTLKNVRVRPGENPFTAGPMALLQGRDNNVEQGRQEALKRVAAKYHLAEGQLLSILKEGDAAHWQK
jgi:hypothetical protein